MWNTTDHAMQRTFLLLAGLAVVLWTGYAQSNEINESFARAATFQRNSNLNEAEAEYRKLLKQAPQYADAQANFGVVLARLGKTEEAIKAYETALRLKPELTPILLNLGILHYRAGQFAKAATALERFIVVAPDHPQARQLLGVSLVELGRDADAVIYLESLLSSPQAEATAVYSLGLAYVRLQRKEVTMVVERLAAHPDGLALSRLLQGQAFLEDFELIKAATEFEAAAKLSSELPRLKFLLGLTYHKLGRTPEAREYLERELNRTPDDFLTLYYLAALLEKQGELNLAHQRIAAALKQEPGNAQALELNGSILLKLGQTAEAVRVLEQAVAQRPENSDARYLLARGLQKLGRKADAAREFAEVERLKVQANEREKARKPNP